MLSALGSRSQTLTQDHSCHQASSRMAQGWPLAPGNCFLVLRKVSQAAAQLPPETESSVPRAPSSAPTTALETGGLPSLVSGWWGAQLNSGSSESPPLGSYPAEGLPDPSRVPPAWGPWDAVGPWAQRSREADPMYGGCPGPASHCPVDSSQTWAPNALRPDWVEATVLAASFSVTAGAEAARTAAARPACSSRLCG